MIFSAEKWDNGAEIKSYVNVSAALSFKKMENPLNNAFTFFLKPVIGDELSERLINIYNALPTKEQIAITGSVDVETKLDIEFLKLCQYAVSNLAFWYDFDAINLRITDAGFQRQSSENNSFSPAYKYQEDSLRRQFKNKGFNMLDKVIDFLYDNLDNFIEFKKSVTYNSDLSSIVKSTDDVNKVYYINYSRLVYLRLQAPIKFATEMHLKNDIGDKLYEQLIKWLEEGRDKEDNDIEKLRWYSARYVIALAVKRLLTDTGSITDRGLYFDTIQPGKNGNTTMEPVGMDRLAVTIQNLECDARMYKDALIKYIRDKYPDYFVGNPSNALIRDNDDKRTFWV